MNECCSDTRNTDNQVERRKGESQLSPTSTTVFKPGAMRASLLSEDQANLVQVAKCFARQLSEEDQVVLRIYLV